MDRVMKSKNNLLLRRVSGEYNRTAPRSGDDNPLLSNLGKIHTTELGAMRIRKNLDLQTNDPVSWCVRKIKQADSIVRRGKNWYVYVGDFVLTINAHSYTIITAHRV